MAQKFPGGISWTQNGEKGGEFHFYILNENKSSWSSCFCPKGKYLFDQVQIWGDWFT